jgi:TolB-like protein/cytochrome c-type biogenesis protein CcmH/NrfG
MSGFFAEIKRRSVIRVAGLYLAGVWLLLQVADTVLPMLDAPDWIARTLLLVLAIGFVPVIVLAWAFEWTPDGLVRDADATRDPAANARIGKRLDRWIMLLLALALGYFAVDKFLLSPARVQTQVQAARQEGRSEAIVTAYGDHSIAVLAFRDMSQARDQGYFSEGIAEQMLNLLTRVQGLRVTSRASAFSFAGKDVDIPTIARSLNVSYVLDGSVRKAGDHIRISAQLIDGRSDTQLWSQTFDRPLQDVFAIQDEIAATVVEQLKIELLGAPPTVRKTKPEALRLYLQSLEAYRNHTPASYEQSRVLARQALDLDPDYVDAWNMLSVVYSSLAGLGVMPDGQGYPLAVEAAHKALAIDPDSADAYAELAQIALTSEDDQRTAARHLEKALKLEPHNRYALGQAATLAKSLGRFDIAVRIQEQAVERDPVMPNAHSELCLALFQSGRIDESIAACGTALKLGPDRIITHFTLATALLAKGQPQQALAEAEAEPFEPFRMFGRAMAYHSLGDRARSDAELAALIAKYEKDAAYNIAYVEAWRGNADQAFAWLGKAVEYRDSGLPMIAAEPLFANIAKDSRWLPFLRKQGKAPEQLAAIPFEVPADAGGNAGRPAVPVSR